MLAEFKNPSNTKSFISFANSASSADQVRIGSDSNSLVLSTNYTERARIDSSGNLLVGTTDSDPSNNNTGNSSDNGFAVDSNGKIRVGQWGGDCMKLNRTGSDGNIVTFRKDGSTVGSIGNLGTRMCIDGNGVSGINFSSGALIPRNNGSASDNIINIGGASNRFKDLYLSGGVYLGGTGAANKLDDYEEGSWLPEFGAAVSNPTITYTYRVGRYVKVGNMVFIQGRMQINTVSGGSGTLKLQNFPFVSEAAAYSNSVISLARQQQFNVNFAGADIAVMTIDNQNFGYFYYNTDTTTNHQLLTSTALKSGTHITFSGCYYATA